VAVPAFVPDAESVPVKVTVSVAAEEDVPASVIVDVTAPELFVVWISLARAPLRPATVVVTEIPARFDAN